MKILLTFLSITTFLLAGCSTTPIHYKFPDPPTLLMAPPQPMSTISTPEEYAQLKLSDEAPSNKKLSEILKVITDNYTQSNQYRLQIQLLQNWIKDQKAINP